VPRRTEPEGEVIPAHELVAVRRKGWPADTFLRVHQDHLQDHLDAGYTRVKNKET
jgi:hypothetical protein